jgi:pyruvate dehydrogenase E2 component (dihydrolipoamide acetyltransferase)
LGVDLHQVEGSGPGGRVTSDDVRSYAEEGKPAKEEKPATEAEETEKEKRPAREMPAMQAGAPELPDFTRWGEVERVPLRSFRRTIARRMAQSWSQIPHVTHHDRADITELEQVRREYRGEMDLDDLTMTVFAMKAVVAALQEIPLLNASIDMESQEIILKHYYHLGIAVDTERGLTVPVVRDVDQKRITELVDELTATIERARAGESSLEDLQGGTFTITNVGPLGGTHFDPLVNFPQVGILGMAQARWQPVVLDSDDGDKRQIEPRYMLPLVLSFDHRVADGADAARFVSSVVRMLEDPNKLMLMM